MKRLVCLLVVVLSIGGLAAGARILAFFPLPSKSHQAVFSPLLTALAAKGHEVTFFSPHQIADNPPNIDQIIIPNPLAHLEGAFDVIEFGQLPGLVQSLSLGSFGLQLLSGMCTMDEMKRLLHTKQSFDLLMTESYFIQEAAAALQHRFGVPTIDLLPLGGVSYASWFTGTAFNPSYMVDYKTTATDRMNFLERVINTANVVGSFLLGHFYVIPKTQELVDKCFVYEGSDTRPPIVDLLYNKSLVFYNSHFSLNYAYPSPPNAVDIAGINIHPPKPLPKEVKSFMEGAKQGVVYFSLGSNVNVSDVAKGEIFEAFLSAFGKIKQKVLWKWEKDNFPGKPDNVMISTWFPQQEILAHPNCKLFISHGGYLSLSEAVNYGVPLIGVPIFGDQPKNVRHAVEHGYGLRLDFANITEASVSWAINQILSNPSYRQAAKARSLIFKDRPMSALETGVYWTEYVIRHRGAPQLKPALVHLHWYQYILLDVAAFYISIVAGLVLLFYLMLRRLFGMICGFGNKSAAKKQKQKTN